MINLRRKLKGLGPVKSDDVSYTNGDQVNSLDVEGDAESDFGDSDRDTTSSDEDELELKLCNGEEQHNSLQRMSSSSSGCISKQTVPHLGAGLIVTSNRCNEWVFSFSFSLFSMLPSLAAKVWDTGVDPDNDSGADAWSVFTRQVELIRNNPRIAVFLLRSGRFAAALFDGPSMLAHKVS